MSTPFYIRFLLLTFKLFDLFLAVNILPILFLPLFVFLNISRFRLSSLLVIFEFFLWTQLYPVNAYCSHNIWNLTLSHFFPQQISHITSKHQIRRQRSPWNTLGISNNYRFHLLVTLLNILTCHVLVSLFLIFTHIPPLLSKIPHHLTKRFSTIRSHFTFLFLYKQYVWTHIPSLRLTHYSFKCAIIVYHRLQNNRIQWFHHSWVLFIPLIINFIDLLHISCLVQFWFSLPVIFFYGIKLIPLVSYKLNLLGHPHARKVLSLFFGKQHVCT